MSHTLRPGETEPLFFLSATIPFTSIEADVLFAAWGAERMAYYAAMAEEDRAEHAKRGEVWATDDHGIWAWRQVPS